MHYCSVPIIEPAGSADPFSCISLIDLNYTLAGVKDKLKCLLGNGSEEYPGHRHALVYIEFNHVSKGRLPGHLVYHGQVCFEYNCGIDGISSAGTMVLQASCCDGGSSKRDRTAGLGSVK